MEMLSLPVHNLFMELQSMTSDLESFRSIGFQNGFFYPVKKRDITSHYFIFPRALDSKRVYIGKDSDEINNIIERYNHGKKESEKLKVESRRLSKMLKASGLQCLDVKTFKVIDVFNDGGVFRLGGVLIGTHAFNIIGNALCVQWEHSAIHTQDIDFAKKTVKFASSKITENTEKLSIPDRIKMLDMGLTPVPALKWNEPSVSFVNKKGFKVEFLVPLIGKELGRTLFIKDFNVGAQPMRFLDYLIEETFETTAVSSIGSVLVVVPNPARFAFHKLIVAGNRPFYEESKAWKDVHQSSQLFNVLMDTRPDELQEAREALTDPSKQRGEGWLKHVRKGLTRMDKHNMVCANRIRKAFSI